MRMRRRLSPLLLGLALLLTQWLSYAHAIEHPALQQDKACAVCILGANLDSGAPLMQAPTIVLLLQSHRYIVTPAPITGGQRPLTTRARAPPLPLA